MLASAHADQHKNMKVYADGWGSPSIFCPYLFSSYSIEEILNRAVDLLRLLRKKKKAKLYNYA